MMRLCQIALPLMLAVSGCASDYTKSEAPNNLRVDGAETRVDIAFTPGSVRLDPVEAARLDRLVASGIIRPADRVTIGASGPPGLAEQRTNAISRELLRFGIVTDKVRNETVSVDHAIVAIGRYSVTLPPCPNWSEPPNAEYTNAHTSNWGCAAATNLGLMVANPADLVNGRRLAPADGMPAVTAVTRYLNDRVKQPPTPTASPFAPTANTGGGGDTAGTPGAVPTSGVPPGGVP